MNSVNVTACQYQVMVYDSLSDAVRGRGSPVTEVFIAEYKAGFSSTGYVFKSEKPRNVEQHFHSTHVNPTQEITVPRALAEKVDQVAKAKLKLSEDEKQIQRDIDSLFQNLTKPSV